MALALARSMQVGLLVEHAQWALDTEGDPSFAAVAGPLARTPLEPVIRVSTTDADAILAPVGEGGTDE